MKSLQIACYGCGTAGIIKNTCARCKNDQTKLQQILHVFIPIIYCYQFELMVTIYNGIVFACSGAELSIAGAKLYKVPKSTNCFSLKQLLNYYRQVDN